LHDTVPLGGSRCRKGGPHVETHVENRICSAARLAHLRRIADAKARDARALSEASRDIAAALPAARIRLAEAESDPDLTSYQSEKRATAKRRISEAEARVRELEEALEAAQADAQDAQSQWETAARLAENCEQFARDRDLPLPTKIGRVGPDPFAGQHADGEVIS